MGASEKGQAGLQGCTLAVQTAEPILRRRDETALKSDALLRA